MNGNKIKNAKYPVAGFLKENGIKQQTVANIIGKTLSTTNRKIRGKTDFSVAEIKLLHNKLAIPIEIFFK
ncbi:helix-turn-helix transcriptional regulator [Paucilactobacillus kaifaensis]|uniref:helix-turn-helix transcriptional regulator n=1 Tax=Paucilactobacillus kaifaensis TaxID=2559921 RepID=UPI0010F9511D|nr:helix-turn-helix transcriptional regulator [Paucilactobacillus kaifaensis]